MSTHDMAAEFENADRVWKPVAAVGIQRSESIAKLASALAKAQAEIEGAAKDSVNPHFKSRYADLAAVWDACRKPLTKHELAVLQLPRASGCDVTVTTLLVHSSGEWIAESLTLLAGGHNAQAVGSAITYGRRYGLSAMVGIAPDDDDAEAAEGRATTQPQQQARSSAPINGGMISEPQAARLFALAKESGWSGDELKAWLLKTHQIDSLRTVPRAIYDKICAEVQTGVV